MMKTITMLNENGKPFSRTYPRRADNLVRKGWARWVDESKIEIIPTGLSNETERMTVSESLYSKAFEYIIDSDVDSTTKNEQVMKVLEMEFSKDNHAEQLNSILEELHKLTPFAGSCDMPALGQIITAIEALDDADGDAKVDTLKDIAFRIMETKIETFSRLENIIRCIVESTKSE